MSAGEWVERAGELMPFDVISETSPRRLVRLHEVTGYDLVIVDLPGGLKRSGELRAVLTGTDGSGSAVGARLAVLARSGERNFWGGGLAVGLAGDSRDDL
jgi:hypothetical protein